MGNLYSERVLNEFVSSDFLTAMDILELVFGFAERSLKDFYDHDRERCGISLPPDAAALLLNQRFLEHDLGYQLIGDQIVRIDSQHLHADVVSPALHLLYEQTFRGASDEYLRAHEHYRRGRYEESVADALKAFESTMKQICDERGWEYPAGATARRLVQVLLNRGLPPTYADNYHNILVGLLEGGVPTIRNSTAGHGTGSTPRDVSPHLASFTLHLAAANIVYLVEVHKAMARP